MSTYTGYFKNRRSEQWSIQVTVTGGSDSNSLTLADNPLIIEMDDNDDMLSPVRLTTGYLRVIGYISDLYPTRGSQVSIAAVCSTNGHNWQGYLQPQAYDIDVVTHSSDVYEIPVECPLSALAHIDLPVAYFGDFPSFGTILYYIMQTQSGSWVQVCMPSTIEGQNVLSCRIDRRLLVETDSNGNEQPKYNCLEFIEEFCKFFGYCCRYDGNGGMLFMRMFWQQTSYAYIGMNNLPSAYSSSYWYTGNYSSITGSKANYASTNQKFQIIPGFRKVKVNADVAKATTTLFEMPNNWLCDFMYGTNVVHNSAANGDYICYEAVASRSHESSFEHDGWKWEFLASNTMKDSTTIKSGARLILINYTSGKVLSSEWKPAIEVAAGTTSSPLFRLSSTRRYCLDGGLLVISGTTYTKHKSIKYSGNGYVRMKIGYGGYYYDKTHNTWSWSNDSTPITVGDGSTSAEEDNKDSTGQIVSTMNRVDSRLNYKGGFACVINLDESNMQASQGQIELEIYLVNLTNYGNYDDINELCIEDLKIEFLPDGMKNVAFEEKDEAYVYNTGSNFRQDKEISVLFASDKYKIPGANSLYDNYGALVSTLPFYYGSTEYQHPEYFVAKYAGIFGSRTHKILDIEVDASETGWFYPLTVIYGFEPSGRPWYVISVDKDFANCTQRIRAIDI